MNTVSTTSRTPNTPLQGGASVVRKPLVVEVPPETPRSRDVWEPSGKATPKEDVPARAGTDEAARTKAVEAGWGKIDPAQFREEMRAKLLEQIDTAKQSLREAGVAFFGGEGLLYEIPEAQAQDYSDEVMGVGKDWGAEATSKRIVDFALAFRGHAEGMTDEEFVEKIRGAIEEGFKLAKGDLGEVPGPTGKLFNDTYKATMDLLDQALEDMRKGRGEEQLGQAASTVVEKASESSLRAGFSVVA